MKIIMAGFSLLVLAGCLCTGMCADVSAEEMHAVIYNARLDREGAPAKWPDFCLEEVYGIKEHCYWPARDISLMTLFQDRVSMSVADWKKEHEDAYQPLDKTFAENLSRSKLLYIGQYTQGLFEDLFTDESYTESIKEFLRGGGTVLFDFYSGHNRASGFLEEVGADVPEWKRIASYDSYICPEHREHAIFNVPNKIPEDRVFGGHGGFVNWTENHKALLRDTADTGEVASLILQENILGEGRLLFLQTSQEFRPAGLRRQLTDNIIAYVYGVKSD